MKRKNTMRIAVKNDDNLDDDSLKSSQSKECSSPNSSPDDSDSESSSSGRSVDVEKFGEKHEEWAKNIMRDLREEWKLEDEMMYMLKPEKDDIQELINKVDERVDELN